MNKAQSLRRLLQGTELIVAPGAYDGISASLVQHAGFPAAYMTGSGTASSRGFPDYGLLTMTEMVENAGVLARSISIPLIADADTGFGNELNVTRAVREYEMRGVAGIHIEDQVMPKKCGHLDGKELVPLEDFLSKIRAAVAARTSPDFVVIARTDARAVTSLDDAVMRANAALRAGADVAFVEAAQSLEEMRAIPQRVDGPCLLNLVHGGKTPIVDLDEVKAMGYRIVILPSLLTSATFEACEKALHHLRDHGRPPAASPESGIKARFARLGAAEWDSMRTKFRAP
jgi:2-methylisocitrate lyase-like PEP mutase family enzyme